jgi:hypothetical protein
VDSLVKRLDDRRFARKFTPRRADSRLSAVREPVLRDGDYGTRFVFSRRIARLGLPAISPRGE